MHKMIVLILAMGLALASCQSAEEKKSEWMKFCQEGEFSVKQCTVLYALKESSDKANSSAGFAAGMSSAAVGISK